MTFYDDTVQNWNLLLLVFEKLYLFGFAVAGLEVFIFIYGYFLTPYLYMELNSSAMAYSLTSSTFLPSLCPVASLFTKFSGF